MLYLARHAASAELEERFDTRLSLAGREQAKDLACTFEILGVEGVYAAPHRRALGTVRPFVLSRRERGFAPRVEVHHDLTDAVLTPHSMPGVMDLTEAKAYGLNRQSLYGAPPDPETQAEFQKRVTEWFTNEFMPKFEDAPVPTVIVADAMTISVIIYYIMRRKSYALVRPIIEGMEPATIVAFKGNGLVLEYDRTL